MFQGLCIIDEVVFALSHYLNVSSWLHVNLIQICATTWCKVVYCPASVVTVTFL